MDGMSPDSELVGELLRSTPRGTSALWELTCPYLPLPASWSEYEDSLAKNFRRNLRRRLRKLENESTEPVRLDTVTGTEGLDRAYDDLVGLHVSARERNGDSGAFDSRARREFYRAVVRRFADRGWLRLHRLLVGERALAAALCFHYGGKTSCYQLGYDLDSGQYGPGYLIVGHVIRSAIEEGAYELDLLRGDHPYKYEWTAHSRSILKLRLASTLAGGVVAPLTGLLRAAKHGWKEWRRT
jgi:CelD/BcsL family acetyltransferase involved in cellulose biosynthesis